MPLLPYDNHDSIDGDSAVTTMGSVLVIDDDSTTRGVLRDLLALNGFSVLTAK